MSWHRRLPVGLQGYFLLLSASRVNVRLQRAARPHAMCVSPPQALRRLHARAHSALHRHTSNSVPAANMITGPALGYGAILTIIAICSKVVTGVFEWDSKWSVGWAMVGRGELGLVMAEEAYRTGLTDKVTFASTVRHIKST